MGNNGLEELGKFLKEMKRKSVTHNVLKRRHIRIDYCEGAHEPPEARDIRWCEGAHEPPEVRDIREETDRPCDCEAQIICTKASEDAGPLHIKKEDELIHKNGSVTLNETDVKLDGVFKTCMATGKETECVINNQENIIAQKWEGTDKTVIEDEDKKTVTYQESYMICAKGGCLYCLDSSEELTEYMNMIVEENEGVFIPERVEGEMNGTPITLYPTRNWGIVGKGKYGGGVQKDEEGRYKIAVGPKILDPFYPDNGKLWHDDFENWSQQIDILLENKYTGAQKLIECVVVDVKAHTYNIYPKDTGETASFNVESGLIQTGIAYPNSSNTLSFARDTISGSVIEFAGHDIDFKIDDYMLLNIFLVNE